MTAVSRRGTFADSCQQNGALPPAIASASSATIDIRPSSPALTESDSQTVYDGLSDAGHVSDHDAALVELFQERMEAVRQSHDDEMDNQRQELEWAFYRIDRLEDKLDDAVVQFQQATEIVELRRSNLRYLAALLNCAEHVNQLSEHLTELSEAVNQRRER